MDNLAFVVLPRRRGIRRPLEGTEVEWDHVRRAGEFGFLELAFLRTLQGQRDLAPGFAFQLLDGIFDGETFQGHHLGGRKCLAVAVFLALDFRD